MEGWEEIFKERGKIFTKPQEDMKEVIRLLKKEKVKRVLDLGCGSGRHTVLLAKHGFDVYATDISETGLKMTRKWLKERGLKAKTKKASCFKKFPFKDNFFDAVISIQVIHHARIKNIRYCISEMERVLKPGGIIFITVTRSGYRKYASRFKKIAPRTYLPLDGREKGLTHYVYNQHLLKKDFKNFKILDLYLDSRRRNCLLAKLKEKR